jgi:hypothetical protein
VNDGTPPPISPGGTYTIQVGLISRKPILSFKRSP